MSKTKPTLQGSTVLSVLLAVLVVCGMIAGTGAVAASDTGIDAQELEDSDVDPADEIYVDEDGNAVLVYNEDDGDDELNQFDIGMHVGEGLMHTLIAGEDEDLNEGDSGSLSLVLEDDRFFGEGDLDVNSPEEIEQMDLDVSAEQTDENSEFDGSFEAVVPTSPETADIESFETSGDMSVTPDTFTSTGTVNAEMATVPPGEFYYDVSITETANGYTADITQDELVSPFQAPNWETEAAAQATLEAQYTGIAAEFGGSEEVTIHSYEYTETESGEGDLDITYTVEYTNIDDGLVDVFGIALAQDRELDLSPEEAEEIAQSVVDMEIDTIDFTAEQSGSSLSANWNVELGNYDGVAQGIVELTESMDDGELDDQLDDLQTSLDAQQAAGLEQHYDWSVVVEQYDAQHDRVAATVTADADNWAEYTQELEDRGAEGAIGDMTLDVSATVEDDDLVADMSMELEQEDLVDDAIDAMVDAAMDDPTIDPETNEFLASLENSEFEIAKMDVNVDGENVELEAGAKFGDLEALTDEVDTAFGGHEVTQMAGTLSDDSMSVHVHVNDLSDPGADEDEIRQLGVADDDTDIHTGGDWDMEFNTMDTESAQQYLGLNEDGENGGDGEDEAEDDEDSLPGFGPLAAVLSLIAVALFGRYRN